MTESEAKSLTKQLLIDYWLDHRIQLSNLIKTMDTAMVSIHDAVEWDDIKHAVDEITDCMNTMNSNPPAAPDFSYLEP